MLAFADITEYFVGSGPASVSGKRRLRRWDLVKETFPELTEMSVLDLGGTAESWLTAGLRPKRLVLLNPFAAGEVEGADSVIGDACDPPDEIREQHFDLVFSNLVIEHVGGHAKRQGFADTARTLGDRIWVQTPYRYFPVEPHFVAPGMQFLPIGMRARALKAWPMIKVESIDEAVSRLQNVELLSRTEMAAYFPDCSILVERFAGMPKSLIAIR
jgi:hypothetical protein